MASLLTGSLIVVVLRGGHQVNGPLLSDLIQSAVVIWAGACVLYVAPRSSGYLRRLWFLLASSLALAAVAQILKTYYKNVVHLSFLAPWPSDVLFILWVIPVLMMFLPRPEEDPGRIHSEEILDFVQVGIAALTAYLYFFYLTSRWQAEGSRMVLNAIHLQMYRDLIIAAAFVIGSRTSTFFPTRVLFKRMMVFFLLNAGWGIAFSLNWPAGSGSVNWREVAWCIPYLFLTAVAATWKTEEIAIEKAPGSLVKTSIFSRALPVCIPLLVLLMGRRIAAEQSTLAWAAITASFTVSLARLILTNEKQRRVTENLRQTEAALEQSAEMFTAAFRSSPDAISISLLPDGRYVAVNESFLRMTGYAEEEVLGKSAAGLRLWADEDHRSKTVAKLQSGTEIRGEEFSLRTKTGEIRTAQVSAARVQLGGSSGLLGIVRDVTERKRAEELLRVSEERFRTLVQNLHIGIVLLGPKAETLFANRAVLATFATVRDEVLGKSSAQFEATAIFEDGREMPFGERPAPRAIATKSPVYGEIVGWRREGSTETLWTLVDAIPHLTADGEVANVLLSISNITERKQAEEALHQLSARLLRLQDEERRRLGRELHDSLAQSVMAVSLDLAQLTRSSPTLEKRARHALAEAREMLREMSRQIRSLSYLLHPPVLDELGLASAVKEYAQGFGERSGISLELDVQSDFARISEEAEIALFRIVQESLANIQRHSGSATAKISLHADQGRIELEISDRGRGIGADTGKAGKRSRLGVGILGMRERMTQLGGALEIRSDPSGTTVLATIPLATEEVNATTSHSRG